MHTFLLIINILLSILIIFFILIQGRGAGLGSAWGGSGESFQTRRGLEKWTLRISIVLIVLFFIVSLINLLV
ncbi:MAG TPA: preprotein translocase subunit SecG [Candidatus Nitrosocosmicus sp.]|nr:preprotein translocase subunit SecG [Candidatus Nitrosocosmicus sp.]